MSKWDAPIQTDEISVYSERILKLLTLTSMSSPSLSVKEMLCQIATDLCPNVRGKQIEYELKIGTMEEQEALLVILKEWVKKEGDGATCNKLRTMLTSDCHVDNSDSNEVRMCKRKRTSINEQVENSNIGEGEANPKRKIPKRTPPIAENWSEKVKKLNSITLLLLNRMAYLNPDELPQDLLDHLLPISIKPGGNSSEIVLSKCSFITKKKLNRKVIYSVPRGLQEYLKSELVKEGKEKQILDVLLQRFGKLNHSENLQENAKVYFADNIEHAFNIWKYAVNYDQLIESHSGQLCDIFYLLEFSKRDLQEKGIEFGKVALAKFKTALGSMHRDCIELEKNIAVIGYLLGKCEESAKKLNELGRKYGEVVEEDNNLLLDIKAEEAEALTLLGRYNEALEIQLPVWETRREKNGEAAYETLLAEYRYATSVWKTGKLEEALEMFKWLVEKEYRAKNDASHDCVLKAEMSEALILSDLGKNLEALKILKGAYEKITSKPQTMTAELYAQIACNVGEVLLDLKNFTEAAEYLEHDFKVVEKYFGSENCWTLRLLKALGEAYRGDGNEKKLLEMALDIHEKAYQGFLVEEGDSVEVLCAKDEVALDLSFLGRHKEAIEMFKDIIKKMKDLQGDADLLADFQVNYAEALGRSGEINEEALRYLREVKEELDKKEGKNTKRVKRVDEIIKRIEGKEVL